ncbi:Exo-glucosaminidase LytG precursor [compost metagenome]
MYNGVRHDNVTANWRAYDSIQDCFSDQDILFTYSRYARVRAATSPQEQTNALYLCGYATDPNYAAKLDRLINQNGIQKYDILEEDEDNVAMKLEQWQWDMLYKVMGTAYNAEQLGWDWMQKIVDKTLSASELAFLNTVLAGRVDRGIEV